MNKFTKLKHLIIINLRFKKICHKNNFQEIKKFYKDDHLNYHQKIINENKSVTSIFHNYLYHNKTKREILLWFILNKLYNKIFYDLCEKKIQKK